MSSDKINRWLTLIANFGVLIGIALVILELDQNRQAAQAQTRTELTNGIVELLTAHMGDSEYADILHRGNAGEPLTDVEHYQYWRHRVAMIEYHENVYYQFRQGLYDDDEFYRQMAVIRADLSTFPGYGEAWCQMRSRMSPAMINAVLSQSDERLCNND